jgi:hypothetical protein
MSESAWQLLATLAGQWQGQGVARYPTTATFDYNETLTFTAHESQPMLHYEQRTHKRPVGTTEFLPSHWESGFWRLTSPMTVEIASAQSGGRVEVLLGELTITTTGLRLSLTSQLLANDDRMVATARTFWLQGDTLKYAMAMSLQRVPELSPHLEATLYRVQVKE